MGRHAMSVHAPQGEHPAPFSDSHWFVLPLALLLKPLPSFTDTSLPRAQGPTPGLWAWAALLIHWETVPASPIPCMQLA